MTHLLFCPSARCTTSEHHAKEHSANQRDLFLVSGVWCWPWHKWNNRSMMEQKFSADWARVLHSLVYVGMVRWAPAAAKHQQPAEEQATRKKKILDRALPDASVCSQSEIRVSATAFASVQWRGWCAVKGCGMFAGLPQMRLSPPRIELRVNKGRR